MKGKTQGRPDAGPPVVMQVGLLEMILRIGKPVRWIKSLLHWLDNIYYAGWEGLEEQEGPVVSQSPHLETV